MPIETANLIIERSSPARLRAFLESSAAYEKGFGVGVAAGLREFWKDVPQTWIDEVLAAGPENWKHGYHVIHKADRMLIGFCGFKGPPDADGLAELGYGIAPRHQGRGLATEAAWAVTEHYLSTGKLRTVRAHTLPSENPSTGVLKKCGFTKIGEVIEPDDGLVWRWERSL
jgi:[ribosomal protein S5]-alanine N-acetyltransferase